MMSNKKHRFGALVVSSTLLVAGMSAANATTILYSDFSDTSALTLNGTAAGLNPNSDNRLRLTNSTRQSSSAFSTDAITLGGDVSFSTAFSFNISNPVGISDSDGQGADGITFTLQTNKNTAGGAGGGIGYQGITNSLGIEFDTWNNGAWDDHSGNHVGINLGGNIDSVMQTSIGTRMNNGEDWFAWVDYNGLSDLLEVRLNTQDLRPTDALLSYSVDLAGALNSNLAFVGFTSGTGSAGGQHDILNWQFNSRFEPIGSVGQTGTVPAPAPIALMLAGLAACLVGRRRRQ